MSKSQQGGPRKPATKYGHLRKRMAKQDTAARSLERREQRQREERGKR